MREINPLRRRGILRRRTLYTLQQLFLTFTKTCRCFSKVHAQLHVNMYFQYPYFQYINTKISYGFPEISQVTLGDPNGEPSYILAGVCHGCQCRNGRVRATCTVY